MPATEQELSWARAIKTAALKKGVEPVSDLLYLQMAIISKDKVKKGVNRLAKLEKFRKKHNISGDAVKDDAMGLMKMWYDSFPGVLGSFGRNAEGQAVQVVHVKVSCTDDGIPQAASSKLTCNAKNYFPNKVSDDFWVKMPRATYYMLNAMNADVDAIRAGYVSVSDCGDMGWANFSLKAQQMQSEIFNDAYPIRIGLMHLLDPPIMVREYM